VLVVFRDGRKMSVEVNLSNRQEMDQRSEAPSHPEMGSVIKPLGLTLHDLSSDLATQLGFTETTRGLLVLSIDPHSSLAGNVEVYDVLEEVARTPVATIVDVRQALGKSGKGEVLLRFKRKSRTGQRSHIVVWQRS
jgi:serine protease Do